jgi:hypothetical protein
MLFSLYKGTSSTAYVKWENKYVLICGWLWKEKTVAYFKVLPQDFLEAESKTTKFHKNLTWAQYDTETITTRWFTSYI